jgi:hypothetical protein
MGGLISYITGSSIIDDIKGSIKELELDIDINNLTENDFIEKIYKAIIDKYKNSNKSEYLQIIKKLKEFNQKILDNIQKYTGNQKKTELILTKVMELGKKIKLLEQKANSINNKYKTKIGSSQGITANTAATSEGKNQKPLTATSAPPSEATSEGKNQKPLTATSAPPSEGKNASQSVDNNKSKNGSSPADPKEIFKLIKKFEFKFSTNFFTKKKNGKTTKTIARNTTKPDDVFNFLKVLLLYKKIFPNEENDYIDQLIRKYSTLCPKVDDIKCGLTKEKNSFFGKINTYNSNSQKIKELSESIKNKNSKNFSDMLDEIIPRSNANKKIEDENMKKIESKIHYFNNRILKLRYFSGENGEEILNKYLDFIKLLLLFKKIMKNKYIYKDSSIDSLIKKYIRECSFKEAINESENERLKKCKSSKTQLNSGSWKYELINTDPEFAELLQDGWKNDEEFNKLRDKFNTMLDKYYTIFKVPEDERVKILSANSAAKLFQKSNNNSKSNANTVVGQSEQNNLNDELAKKEKSKVFAVPSAVPSADPPTIEESSGGSRKKSKKSRS